MRVLTSGLWVIVSCFSFSREANASLFSCQKILEKKVEKRVPDYILPAFNYPAAKPPVTLKDVYDDPEFWKQLAEGPVTGVKRYWFHYGTEPSIANDTIYWYSSDMKAHLGWGDLYITALSRPIIGTGIDLGEWEIGPRGLSTFNSYFYKTERAVVFPLRVPDIRELQKVLEWIDFNLIPKGKTFTPGHRPWVLTRLDLHRFLSLAPLSEKLRAVLETWQPLNQEEEDLKRNVLAHTESYEQLLGFLKQNGNR